MKKIFALAIFATTFPTFLSAAPAAASNDRQIHEIVFQNYPQRALEAGEEGPVFFDVTIDKDGHPLTCQVTHGSGFRDLDEETCDLIVKHAVFKGSRDAVKTEGVVNWTLPGHTPAPINFGAVAAVSKPEAQVCKKNLRIGTLSSYERTCMTPSQWAKQSDEQKQTYDEMQGRKGFTSEGMCQGPACDQQAYQRGLATGGIPQ